MGTLAIYGLYLVTRLLSCTACYIFAMIHLPYLPSQPALHSGGKTLRPEGHQAAMSGSEEPKGSQPWSPPLEEFPPPVGRATGECPHLGKRLYWKDPQALAELLPEIMEDFLKGEAFPNVPRPTFNPSIDTNNMIQPQP